MAEGCLAWTGREWFDEYVSLGNPTGPLPYPDGSFDLVYTSEVLLHSRPEHLDTILSELIRVCRGHILHIETSQHIPLCATPHHGCWRHDLPSAYARLGRDCESLPSGYKAHEPFRVVIGQQPRFTWSPVVLALYRRMEQDIDEGFAADTALHQESAAKSAAALAAAVERLAAKDAEMSARDLWLATKDEHIVARDQQLAAQAAMAGAVGETVDLQRAALADLTVRFEEQRSARDAEVAALTQQGERLASQLQQAIQRANTLEEIAARDRGRVAALEAAHAQANAAAVALLAQRQEFLHRVAAKLRP